MAGAQRDFVWVVSQGQGADEGGVAIVVQRSLLGGDGEFVSETLVEVESQCADQRRGGGGIHLVCSQFGVEVAAMAAAMDKVRKTFAEAAAGPCEAFSGLQAISTPMLQGKECKGHSNSSEEPEFERRDERRRPFWEAFLRMMTEVDQPMCTRMAESATAAMSRIGRIYTTALGWILRASTRRRTAC